MYLIRRNVESLQKKIPHLSDPRERGELAKITIRCDVCNSIHTHTFRKVFRMKSKVIWVFWGHNLLPINYRNPFRGSWTFISFFSFIIILMGQIFLTWFTNHLILSIILLNLILLCLAVHPAPDHYDEPKNRQELKIRKRSEHWPRYLAVYSIFQGLVLRVTWI